MADDEGVVKGDAMSDNLTWQRVYKPEQWRQCPSCYCHYVKIEADEDEASCVCGATVKRVEGKEITNG